MAEEINVQAMLAFQRSTVALQGSGTKVMNQDPGAKAEMKQIKINTSAVRILTTTASHPGTTVLASVGYLFVKNIDLTTANIGSVQLALADWSGIFAKLEKDDLCLIPIRQSPIGSFEIYAKGTFPGTAYDIPILLAFTEI